MGLAVTGINAVNGVTENDYWSPSMNSCIHSSTGVTGPCHQALSVGIDKIPPTSLCGTSDRTSCRFPKSEYPVSAPVPRYSHKSESKHGHSRFTEPSLIHQRIHNIYVTISSKANYFLEGNQDTKPTKPRPHLPQKAEGQASTKSPCPVSDATHISHLGDRGGGGV